MSRPLVALTMGDPAGIGPEIVLKAVARRDVRNICRPVVFGDARWLAHNLTFLPKAHPARRLVIAAITSLDSLPDLPRGVLPVVDFGNVPSRGQKFGVPTAVAGKASGDYLQAAVNAVLSGTLKALVTAPINKISFRMGGFGQKYVGHTEMLADLTCSRDARLMLVHGRLRAVHVTSHVALRDVPRLVTTKRVLDTIRVTHRALVSLGIKRPRLAVCGLNPHAGDGGILGKEEKAQILPAVKRATRAGILVEGPLSADVVWPRVLDGRFDAGIAMYHDQGQIAVKLVGFKTGVNVTLDLPIIRTSPAHGTAYDIAGKGVASEESFAQALFMAARMAARG